MNDDVARAEAFARYIDGMDDGVSTIDAGSRALVLQLEREMAGRNEIEAVSRERVWRRVSAAGGFGTPLRARPRWILRGGAAIVGLAAALAIAFGIGRVVAGSGSSVTVAEALLVQPEAGPPSLTYLNGDASDALDVQTDSFGDRYLQWSPDGSRLAFVNGGDVWLLDADGRKRKVTDTSDRVEGLLSWSPDGKRLAFASAALNAGEAPDVAAPVGGRLTLVNADGSGYEVVGQEDGMLWPPSWSSNGALVAYSAEGRLRIFDVATGGEVGLSPTQMGLPQAQYVDGASFSPVGGDLLVYYAASGVEPSRDELLDGTAPQVEQGFAIIGVEQPARVLKQYDAPFVPGEPPRWSPDGNRVLISLNASPVFGNPTGLWIVNMRDGSAREVRDVVAYQALWSPAGERVAYVDQNTRGVVVIDARTLDVVERPARGQEIAGIAWRPANPR